MQLYTYCYIYILYLGKFHHDLTVLPNPGIMVNKGNHPQMAELFRLVNYYNLPRYICIYIYMYILLPHCCNVRQNDLYKSNRLKVVRDVLTRPRLNMREHVQRTHLQHVNIRKMS